MLSLTMRKKSPAGINEFFLILFVIGVLTLVFSVRVWDLKIYVQGSCATEDLAQQ